MKIHWARSVTLEEEATMVTWLASRNKIFFQDAAGNFHVPQQLGRCIGESTIQNMYVYGPWSQTEGPNSGLEKISKLLGWRPSH